MIKDKKFLYMFLGIMTIAVSFTILFSNYFQNRIINYAVGIVLLLIGVFISTRSSKF